MKNVSIKSSEGYTLIEILLSVTLSLILMLAVVQIFAMVGDFVTNSQAIMEMDQNIRNAQMLLQLDLSRATAKMTPPLDPAAAMGYFKATSGSQCSLNTNLKAVINDNLCGIADKLQFTIHDMNAPLVDYSSGTSKQSSDAEVYWFVSNNKLYRKASLLVGETGAATDNSKNLSQATAEPTNFNETVTNLSPVLENVIKFDVQLWDATSSQFDSNAATSYDTGNRFKGYSTGSLKTNDNVVGYYSPSTTNNTSTAPLKGLRIKVRVVEPTTGQIRDFTIEQDFTCQ